MINRGIYKHLGIVQVICRLGLLNEGNKQAGVVLRSILANNHEIFCILVFTRLIPKTFLCFSVYPVNTQDFFDLIHINHEL